MVSEDPIYEELRKKIDEIMPVGFPASEDGTELRLLEKLFTPEEAKIAIHLSILPERLKVIYRRVMKAGISISLNEMEERFDRLVEKGAIVGGAILDDEKQGKRYSLTQWILGMWELQVDKLTKEFAELAERYSLETFYKELHQKDKPCQMRTIPIEKSLTPEHRVSTYDNIRELLENRIDSIAVMNCICRQEHDLLEKSCKVSDIRRNCISFDNFAEIVLKIVPSARRISKDELLKILDTNQKEGFVIQSENNQNPQYMCFCCGCCCGFLTTAKQFPRPAEYYSSNFYAQSNSELCIGCETCVERCQMDAITMDDGKSSVNLDRCIGCGNCVAVCEANAMSLIKRDEEIIPAKDQMELFQNIMLKKIK
jgi:Na+-translocating ferredoxin:NAD+ oxidoreductase RNF subunit RnfB